MPKSRGLSQGPGQDEIRREIRHTRGNTHRYAGRLSGHRRRGARPGPGNSGKSCRNVATEGPDSLHRYRRGRIGRRTWNRCRRQAGDARICVLFCHIPGGMRRYTLARRRRSPESRPGPQIDQQGLAKARIQVSKL